jgi:hypothetical protein
LNRKREVPMHHRRDYADVSGLEGKPSNVGFLGGRNSGVAVAIVLSMVILAGVAVGAHLPIGVLESLGIR